MSIQKQLISFRHTALQWRRGFFVVVVTLFLLTSTAPHARADAWGANYAAAIMKQVMEKIARQIEGVLLSSAKTAAIQMLNSQINQLVGGGIGGQPVFITDFNAFLYQNPAQKAQLFMNDFFTLSTRGKGSIANYVGIGDIASGIGNYPNYLIAQAQKSIVPFNSDTADTDIQYDLDEYTVSPEAMFREGDFRAFNSFFTNPANNPFGYSLIAEQVYATKLEEEQTAAAVEAQSSGFTGVKQNGVIVTPAGTVEGVVTDIKTLGNKVIASAQNPGELLGGVITSVANRAISSLIQTGMSAAQTKIQQVVNGVNGQIQRNINGAIQNSGPAAPFLRGAIDTGSIRINPISLPPVQIPKLP